MKIAGNSLFPFAFFFVLFYLTYYCAVEEKFFHEISSRTSLLRISSGNKRILSSLNYPRYRHKKTVQPSIDCTVPIKASLCLATLAGSFIAHKHYFIPFLCRNILNTSSRISPSSKPSRSPASFSRRIIASGSAESASTGSSTE